MTYCIYTWFVTKRCRMLSSCIPMLPVPTRVRFLHLESKPPSFVHICTLLFVPFVSTFYYVSYYGEAANLASKVVIPPPVPWALSSVRAGPHYSLLSLLAFRLHSLVLHSPVLVSLSYCRLQPYLPGPQSSRGCVLLSTRSTLFPIISFPRRWRQNIVPTCPQFRTERQHVVQSHWDCERLVQKVVLYIQQLMVF